MVSNCSSNSIFSTGELEKSSSDRLEVGLQQAPEKSVLAPFVLVVYV